MCSNSSYLYLATLYTGKKDDDHFFEDYDYEASVNFPALLYLFKEVIVDVRTNNKLIRKIGDKIFEKLYFNDKDTDEIIEWIEEQLFVT